MASVRRTDIGGRGVAGALADIAHELSSTYDWESRLDNVLSMVCDLVPSDTAALGVLLYGWRKFICREPEDTGELSETLVQHYTMLTGTAPSGEGVPIDQARGYLHPIHHGDGASGSYLSLPVIGADQILGVLHVMAAGKKAYSLEDVSVFSIVASQIGAFVRNVLARMEEERSREEINAARNEALRRLNELDTTFEALVDPTVVFDANGVVIRANSASIDLVGFNTVGFGREQLSTKITLRNPDRQPISPDDLPATKALRGEVTKDRVMIITSATGEERIVLSSSSPLIENGQVVGVVSTWHDITEQKQAEEDLEAAYQREHHIAQVLQNALVSEVDLVRDNFEIVGHLQPASKEADVGGDFYDVFNVGSDYYALVMGDVSGKGLSAAAFTAMAKHMIRAFAHEDPNPQAVMERLNEALCRFLPEDMFITLFYGLLRDDGTFFCYTSAGHEPVLLQSRRGDMAELGATGPAVGMVPHAAYQEQTLELAKGDVMLIYTDGITEARRGLDFFGMEGLRGALAGHAEQEGRKLVDSIFEAALAHARGTLRDDAAVLLVKIASPTK